MAAMKDPTICFGAIFYFFADPASHREALRSSIMLWKDCWKSPFTRMSRYGDSFRSYPMTKSLDQVLTRLSTRTTLRTPVFHFFDGSQKALSKHSCSSGAPPSTSDGN